MGCVFGSGASGLLTKLGDKHPDDFCIAGQKRLSSDAAAVLVDLIGDPPGTADVPSICRDPLAVAGERMRPAVLQLLEQIGRAPMKGDYGVTDSIQMSRALDEMDGTQAIQIKCSGGRMFKCTTRDLQRLGAAARIVSLKDGVNGGIRSAVLPATQDMTAAQQHDAQCVAIIGPVLCICGNDYRTRTNSARPFLVVSIPGINLAYSPVDRGMYCDAHGGLAVRALSRRMRQVWALAFASFRRKNVRWPVLCAIGCGAFKGEFAEATQLWAEALTAQLVEQGRDFDCVIMCCPRVRGSATDNFDHWEADDNFMPFAREIQKASAILPCCCIVIECLSMVSLADALACRGVESGILNPSDPVAVRQGGIGMFWEDGHVALEEVLAMQTTLLLQHRGVNPKLWRDPAKWEELSPPVTEPARASPLDAASRDFNSILPRDEGAPPFSPERIACPLCGLEFPPAIVGQHASTCNGKEAPIPAAYQPPRADAPLAARSPMLSSEDLDPSPIPSAAAQEPECTTPTDQQRSSADRLTGEPAKKPVRIAMEVELTSPESMTSEDYPGLQLHAHPQMQTGDPAIRDHSATPKESPTPVDTLSAD